MSFFFLMSSERSGSNLLTKLLNGHSKICGPSTKHIINPVARNLFRYEPLNRVDNWNELLSDIHRLMEAGFSVWKKSFSLEDLKQLGPIGDPVSLLRNIFTEEAGANGKLHVFIKENHIYEFFPFLLINFPEAKFVYLIRDPRDMALSWKKNPSHPGGVVKAARQWQKDQQYFLGIYNELRKVGKAHFLRYEELIEAPEEQLKQVLHSLGLSFEAATLEFYRDDLTQINAGRQSAWSNLSKGILSDNKNKFVDGLSMEEVTCIEKICYFEMKQLGYQPGHRLEELDLFTDSALHDFEKLEEETIRYERAEGVKRNMDAKKVFYHKVV
jgi:hypothetical protein